MCEDWREDGRSPSDKRWPDHATTFSDIQKFGNSERWTHTIWTPFSWFYWQNITTGSRCRKGDVKGFKSKTFLVSNGLPENLQQMLPFYLLLIFFSRFPTIFFCSGIGARVTHCLFVLVYWVARICLIPATARYGVEQHIWAKVILFSLCAF